MSDILYNFHGKHDFNRDSKGRIQLPSEMRELMVFGDNPRRLTMTEGIYGCISAYMPKSYDYYNLRIRDMEMDKDEKMLQSRRLAAVTFDCRIDVNWRVKLPEELVAYAQIEKEVKILGNLDAIEIWNPSIFEEVLKGKKKIEVSKDREGYYEFIRDVFVV
ncbi:hypothetical protein K9N50_03535 [bacterium]|nr:hypothetical protein [bacterium]